MNNSFLKLLSGLFIASILGMLWSYNSGYNNSIDWEVTTTAEIIEFPAWTLQTDLATHEIKGEKYLLEEYYTGSEIKRSVLLDQVLLSLIWAAFCLFLVASTYLKRYAFFVIVALFALFLNRLNLFEIGLFGIQTKLIVFIPALVLISPLVIFHEYRKNTPLFVRLIVMVLLSGVLLLGVENATLFTDHLIANSLFGFAIIGLLFLFIIGEEIVFSILYVVTSGKGGVSNQVHFLVLSLIYLGNLILYYLNKSGLFENSFFFFDPFILLAISCLVALWSIKFKSAFLSPYLDKNILYLLVLSLGVISILFLMHHIIRGNDAVYEAFHYFILYFHIGFGTLFFLYIIGNFIDPLIKGFEVHKIVYRERNFPYASARLGGFFAVLAFYFLAGQEPFNLLKTGYYNYLAQVAYTNGNPLLGNEYTLQASYLGYNTHYANYSLGHNERRKGNEFPAKTYFLSAAQRFPSSYALINYGNLDTEINASKVQAVFEESLRNKGSGELENNLGIVHLNKGELTKALDYFENAAPQNRWNDAPDINKWKVLKKLELVDTSAIGQDYQNGNFGVKANVLTTQDLTIDLPFEYEGISEARYLHRQSYLLNSSYLYDHDSIENIIRKEIEKSADGASNDRMRKALAIHLYNKGEVNKAFMMLDYLQANSHQYYKGAYFDALGKFALDQGAYTLSLEFFEKALQVKHHRSLFGKLEVLARTGKKDEIPDVLLEELKKNPQLTNESNALLSRLKSYQIPEVKKYSMPELTTLSDTALVQLGRTNAFSSNQVIAIVDELKRRDASGWYELLIDAIEINPYSEDLLKKYALAALEWNLTDYAEQTFIKLKELLTEDEFNSFSDEFTAYKKELEEDSW